MRRLLAYIIPGSLLILLIVVLVCFRPAKIYRARLTVPEFTSAFAPKQPLAPPPLEQNLITIEINFSEHRIRLFSDLAMQNQFLDYPFAARYGFNSVSLVSDGLNRPVVFDAPEAGIIAAPGNMEFAEGEPNIAQ